MINRNFLWLLIGSLIIVLAACGPSGTEPVSVSETASENSTTVQEESQSSILTTGDQDTAVNASTLEDIPIEVGEEVVTASEENETAVEETAVEVDVADAIEIDANGIQVGFTAHGHPYRGNPNASIVIEEFSDYQ